MTNLSHVVQEERTARMLLSMTVEPDDAVTGQSIVAAERAGIGTLIPGDKEWPSALDDLGDRRPYVLWTRGTTSFLARPVDDRVTITGARAATSYGEHVAGQLASDLASAERIVVAGGAYGIEGAAHRARA